MPTTPTEWQSFMRCRSGKARWKTKKIIEFAQRGERDPVRLRNCVLQALQP
jgi:hypothetical protein